MTTTPTLPYNTPLSVVCTQHVFSVYTILIYNYVNAKTITDII